MSEFNIKDSIKVSIQKLVEKKTLGYRFTTNDLVTFETDNERGLLIIDAVDNSLVLDITPQTIEQLSEFIRYIKSDLDEQE